MKRPEPGRRPDCKAGFTATFDPSGNTATDGTDGNLLCYTNNGISVNASAFQPVIRDDRGCLAHLWRLRWRPRRDRRQRRHRLGSTPHGDNNNGTRDNYVLLFETVVVDKAYLATCRRRQRCQGVDRHRRWAFNSQYINLSDAVLSSMGFTEVNATTPDLARWADLNANGFRATCCHRGQPRPDRRLLQDRTAW